MRMTININMQLSHMLADEVGANGDETVIIDALHLSREALTVENLPSIIEANFHITISIDRIRSAVRRMADAGKIVKNSEILSLSPSIIEDVNRIARENKSIEDQALMQWFCIYATLEKHDAAEEWSSLVRGIIVKFISTFFLMHGADCYGFINGSKTQDISKLDFVANEVVKNEDGIDKEKMASFLASIFTLELTSEQESFLLTRLKKAIHYLSMVVDESTMSTLRGPSLV